MEESSDPTSYPEASHDDNGELTQASAQTAEVSQSAVFSQISTHGKWLNILIFCVLVISAIPIRAAHTRGDLWGDEADYALAGARGFAANRWDRSDSADDPEKLIRARHFHPPMTADLLGFAGRFDLSEPSLRMPFVIAGSLAVGLVYLCGLALFNGDCIVSLFCAVVVLFTPLQIRAGSHAIPWSLITLNLLALLWTLLNYSRTLRTGWLIAACTVLGCLFVTSESLFPILLACGLSLPVLFWRVKAVTRTPREIGLALAIGACIALLVILVFWPAGLTGSVWKNIHHYMTIPPSDDTATVGNRTYTPTPRWAYQYWYSHDYRPYYYLYMLGAATVLLLIVSRKLSRCAALVTIFTLVEIAVAHATIILGPEYLAHCLPLLTLLAGLTMYGLSRLNRLLGVAVMLTIGIYLANWQPRIELRALEQQARISRWPAAATVLAHIWRQGDVLAVNPQPPMAAKWYLLHKMRIAASEDQIRALPSGHWRKQGLAAIRRGTFRFLVISSTFSVPEIDSGLRRELKHWHPIWRSEEPQGKPSRLMIFERGF